MFNLNILYYLCINILVLWQVRQCFGFCSNPVTKQFQGKLFSGKYHFYNIGVSGEHQQQSYKIQSCGSGCWDLPDPDPSLVNDRIRTRPSKTTDLTIENSGPGNNFKLLLNIISKIDVWGKWNILGLILRITIHLFLTPIIWFITEKDAL